MQRLTVKTSEGGLIAGLLLAAGVHAQMGQMNSTHGGSGMMQCDMDTSPAMPQSSAMHTPKITAAMASPAKAGNNALDIVLTNAVGWPLTAAKVTAQVAMTSTDMGTTSPSVKETGKGHYTSTVAFSMAGPWRGTVKVIASGQKPQTKAFDFMAG